MLDEVAALVVSRRHAPSASATLTDDGLQVPADITSFIDGTPTPIHLDL